MSPKYRNWSMLGAEYSKPDFEKQMKAERYIMHLFYSPFDGKFIYVILFHHASPHLEKTDMFKRFLDILIGKIHKNSNEKKRKFLETYLTDDHDKKKNKMIKILANDKVSLDAILITKHELTTYCLRGIKSKNDKINLNICNYLHKHFLIEISKGPLCGLHEVLSKQEANILCSQQIMTCRSKLPYIIITDPQLIWCNAKVGDIIKININSELTAKSLRYRIVVPISGKIQNQQFEDELDDEEIEEYDENGVDMDAEPDVDIEAVDAIETATDTNTNKENEELVSEAESEDEDEFDKY